MNHAKDIFLDYTRGSFILHNLNMQTGDTKASTNTVESESQGFGIMSMTYLNGDLYLGGSIRQNGTESRIIPVIAKVHYEFSTFYWAFKRND